MSDYTLPPRGTVVVGMMGSGKTTFCLRYLLNVKAAARFVFDDLGQVAARLRLPHASTAAEVEAALASKWVLFNPHRMFPGDMPAAFAWFCQWSFSASCRGPGLKVFFADEVWRWCSAHSIPKELAMIAQAGRAENMELLTATQTPHKFNSSVTGGATEIVSFRLCERLALAAAADLGAPAAVVQGLPLGSFVAVNRLTGGRLAGKLF